MHRAGLFPYLITLTYVNALLISGAMAQTETTARAPAIDTGGSLAGIRPGMPLKDALETLKKHNPELKLAPESLRYDGIANAMTYGINVVGAGEGFYLLVAMAPNPANVLRVTQVVHFGQDSVAKQEVVAANLVKKFGAPSYDTLPASLSLGFREMLWVEDEHGKSVHGSPPRRCLGQSTFYMNGLAKGSRTQLDPISVRLPQYAAQARIEQGFVNRFDPIADQCAGYTIVHARLFKARFMGISVPNLVEYVTVMMSNGPMDRAATTATHEYWAKTAKRNPPDLKKR